MYKRSRQGWIKHLDFILLDILCLQIALVLGYSLKKGFSTIIYADADHRILVFWMPLFSVLMTAMFGTMHDVLKRGWLVELSQTVVHCGLVFASTTVLLFSIKGSEDISRIVLGLTTVIYAVLAYFSRMAYKRLLGRRPISRNRRVMLLITDSQNVGKVLTQFRNHPAEDINICGLVMVDMDAKGETIDDIQVTANLDEAANYICRVWIDEVFISVADSANTPYELIDKCQEMGVTVHLQLMPTGVGRGKQEVEKIAGMSVMTSSMQIATATQLMLKRFIDILAGIALSALALLAILIVGPIIKIASPGPILYKQERIGQNGRKFKMFKIRSMYMDADERKQELMDQNRVKDGLMFKVDFDPRIIGNRELPDGSHKTGIGEFIRKWSIDELPQGFNLLIGQMSLVGTRPPTVDEWEKYELHHRARLSTKPGITGMWQVSGRSEITDFEEITRLDTEYIADWSLRLDIKIMFKTVGAVLKRKGAM